MTLPEAMLSFYFAAAAQLEPALRTWPIIPPGMRDQPG